MDILNGNSVLQGQPGRITSNPFGPEPSTFTRIGPGDPAAARPLAPRSDVASQPRTGLIPAHPGALFSVTIKDKPRARVNSAKLGEMRGALRSAQAAQQRAEAAWVKSTIDAKSDAGDAEMRKAYTAAVDKVAVLTREIQRAEAESAGRPTEIRMVTAQDPSQVPDAFEDPGHPVRLRCLHASCQGEEWATEREMVLAHPSRGEMARTGQAHVYALWSAAPMDPTDPGGGIIGLIAPVGSDGKSAAAMANEQIADAPTGGDLIAQINQGIVAAGGQAMTAEEIGRKLAALATM